MYSNNSIFKPGISLKQLEAIDGYAPQYVGHIKAYKLNNVYSISSSNFDYYFARVDEKAGLYSIIMQSKSIQSSSVFKPELKKFFKSVVKDLENKYLIEIPVEALLSENNGDIKRIVYLDRNSRAEDKLQQIIVSLNVEVGNDGYITVEYCFDKEALEKENEDKKKEEENSLPVNLENAMLNELRENKIEEDQKVQEEKPFKMQDIKEILLPIIGVVLSVICITLFTFIPLGNSSGPLIKAFEDKSIINIIYFGFSLAFHFIAYFVPIHIYIKIQQFMKSETLERERLQKGESTDNKLWNSYRLTFFNKDFGIEKRTRANADLYFNFDSVVGSMSHKYPWAHALKIIASSFIGLGILGTFIGFSYAMTELKFDPDTMLDSIKNLVENGLATAFNTSIIGVFCSIIYNFLIYTPLVQKSNDYFQRLCDELDTEYYVSETEALMKYSMVTDENDQKVTFSESLRLILQNMNKQSLALERFNSDLAEKMQNINENMNATFEKISSSVSGDLKEVVLEDIHVEMGGLKDSLSSSTEQLNAAAETLKDVVDRIKGDVGEKITSFDEALVESLNNSKEAALHLEAVPEKIQTVSSMLDTAGTSLASVSDTVASNMATIHDGLSDILSDLQTTQDKVSEILAQAKMNEENSGQNLKDVLSETDKVLEGFKEVDKNLSHVFSQLTDQISKYTNTVGGNLDTYLSSFAEASTVFSKSIQGSITEFGDTIDTFNQNLAQMQKTSDSFDASIKHLEKTIKKDNK